LLSPFSIVRPEGWYHPCSHRYEKEARMSLSSEMRDRQRALLAAAVEGGEKIYDPEAGLCYRETVSVDPKREKLYRGHFVAWISPAYAEALLATRADIPRACRILESICGAQELDPGLPFYGNFYAVKEWGAVRDQNAVAFLSVSLGHIWLDYRDLLPDCTRKLLLDALRVAATGLIRRRADVFYTNIYLYCVAGKLLLGRILDRPDLLELAETEWECYVDRVSRENISEYNSPSYQPIHVECLLTILDHATDPRMRREANRMLEYELSLYALHYHRPSGIHAGVMSRAYREGLLTHGSASKAMAHVLFGEPLDNPPEESKGAEGWLWGVKWCRYSYVPPRKVRDLFFEKRFPVRIRERVVSYWGRDDHPKGIELDHYQTVKYSLATQYGVWASYGHYLPFHFTHAGEGRRRSIFFQHQPERPLIDAWFRQDGRTALGAFFWGLPDYRTFSFWWGEPPFTAELICHLGGMDDMDILLDGKAWDGRRQPEPGSVIEVRKKGISARVALLAPPRGVRTPALKMLDIEGDVAILLTFARSKSADRFWRLPPAVQPVLFEVFPGGRPLRRGKTKVTGTVRDGIWTLRAGNLSAAVPVTLEGRNRLAEAMNPPIQGGLISCPQLPAGVPYFQPE
jgi:hypothetical protein